MGPAVIAGLLVVSIGIICSILNGIRERHRQLLERLDAVIDLQRQIISRLDRFGKVVDGEYQDI